MRQMNISWWFIHLYSMGNKWINPMGIPKYFILFPPFSFLKKILYKLWHVSNSPKTKQQMILKSEIALLVIAEVFVISFCILMDFYFEFQFLIQKKTIRKYRTTKSFTNYIYDQTSVNFVYFKDFCSLFFHNIQILLIPPTIINCLMNLTHLKNMYICFDKSFLLFSKFQHF